MSLCPEAAVVEIQRRRAGARGSDSVFIQRYCADHSHLRGVEIVDGDVRFTSAYIAWLLRRNGRESSLLRVQVPSRRPDF